MEHHASQLNTPGQTRNHVTLHLPFPIQLGIHPRFNSNPSKNWSHSLRQSSLQCDSHGSSIDNASPNLPSQRLPVLQGIGQCSRHLLDRLSHWPLSPDPSCLYPGQPRQQPRRHSYQEASRSRSLLRTWKDLWSWSQGSEAAWKGQPLVSGWSDSFDRQAWSKGFQ